MSCSWRAASCVTCDAEPLLRALEILAPGRQPLGDPSLRRRRAVRPALRRPAPRARRTRRGAPRTGAAPRRASARPSRRAPARASAPARWRARLPRPRRRLRSPPSPGRPARPAMRVRATTRRSTAAPPSAAAQTVSPAARQRQLLGRSEGEGHPARGRRSADDARCDDEQTAPRRVPQARRRSRLPPTTADTAKSTSKTSSTVTSGTVDPGGLELLDADEHESRRQEREAEARAGAGRARARPTELSRESSSRVPSSYSIVPVTARTRRRIARTGRREDPLAQARAAPPRPPPAPPRR